MWPSVPGDGRPLCNAIVTFAFPIATPPSNSNSFFRPSARSNHFALRFGLRTARPKWPTTPSVNGIFFFMPDKIPKHASRLLEKFGQPANGHARSEADDDECGR